MLETQSNSGLITGAQGLRLHTAWARLAGTALAEATCLEASKRARSRQSRKSPEGISYGESLGDNRRAFAARGANSIRC
jgi:hypothetical protein